jgi:hypothetical protein
MGADRYDLFVGTIGYETRAAFAIGEFISRVDAVVSAPFNSNHLYSYSENNEIFSGLGPVLPGDEGYIDGLRNHVADCFAASEKRRDLTGARFRVCVDISSMTRSRLAETMIALYVSPAPDISNLTVDWIYAPAHYNRRLLESGPVKFNDAIPGFEGWGDPTAALHAVVGLGLEGDLALGVLDDLETSSTTIFEPMGFEVNYDKRITKRNREFINGVPVDRRFRYDVTQPYTAFLKLSAAVSRLTAQGRVVMLPLGPKIFALMCLLIGAADRDDTTVWRLSVDTGEVPVNRLAAGPIYGLTGSRISGG